MAAPEHPAAPTRRRPLWLFPLLALAIAGGLWWLDRRSGEDGGQAASPAMRAQDEVAADRGAPPSPRALAEPNATANGALRAPAQGGERRSAALAADEKQQETVPSGEVLLVRCVADTPAAEPLPGAEVFVLRMGEESVQEMTQFLASGASYEAWVRSSGVRIVADGQGEARVPVHLIESGALLAGVHGESFGMRNAWAPFDTVELRLMAQNTVRALVLDHEGNPREGVLVGLTTLPEHRIGMGWLRSHTDAQGIATLRFRPSTLQSGSRDQRYGLVVLGLLADPASELLDLAHLPPEPVVLRLGPAGWVDLQRPASLAGRAVPTVSLKAPSLRSGLAREGLLGLLEGEHLRLGPVDLGLELEAQLFPSGSETVWKARGSGPVLPGEVVSLTFESPDILRLTGRAVDEENRPIRRAALRATVVAQKRTTAAPTSGALNAIATAGRIGRLDTDHDGRFSWEIPAGVTDGDWALLTVRQGDAEQQAVFDLHATAETTIELGDVPFRQPRLVVAGWVLGSFGAPVPGAHVMATPLLPPGSRPEGTMSPTFLAPAVTDESGYFEIRGPTRAEELSISVQAGEYPSLIVTAPVGRTDLELVLQMPGSLRGRLLLDPQLNPADLEVRSLPIDRTKSIYRSGSDETRLRADGSFELSTPNVPFLLILDGSYWVGPPLRVVESIEPAGIADSIDLGTIDLRGRLHSTRLIVLDAQERPVAGLTVTDRGESSHGMPHLSYPLSPSLDGTRLHHAALPQAARIAAPAMKGVDIELRGGDLTVRLEAGLQVRIEVLGWEEVPAELALWARYQALEGAEMGTVAFDRPQALWHPSEPGVYSLRLDVRRRSGPGSSMALRSIHDDPSAEVPVAVSDTPDLQEVSLRIDARLRARIEALRAK